MATNTYVALDTQTISGSSTTAITFTSIPSTYTDLVIVANWGMSADDDFKLQVGSSGSIDTATNYSATNVRGNGTTAASGRQTSVTYVSFGLQNVTNPTTLTQNTIFHIMNYSNTTTFKTFLGRANDASAQTIAKVGLWRSTAAINIIQIERATSGTTFLAGSTFTLYGIANSNIGAPKAFGGTITQDANYTYHTFGASGTFTPQQSLTVDYLVVAGGGSGGADDGGGGGGAGGYRTSIGGSALSVTATPYTITVGAGGTGKASGGGRGNSGTTSIFSSISASGGGGGGGYPDRSGLTGGSGGGGGNNGGTGAAGNAGSYSPVEGYAGGNSGSGTTSGSRAGGGGGGAGGSGATGPAGAGTAAGGIGLSSSITGTSVTRAVGGNNGYSGSGVGANGTANYGNGGGGGGEDASGSGGSGIVIIRYAN